MTEADRLIREFEEKLGQNVVDAHRNAFTALAMRRGWSKARIGRYLGISRARVGQKVEKLEHYVHSQRGIPTLKRVMTQADDVRPVRSPHDQTIEWQGDDWADLTFARSAVELVA